MSSVVFSRAVLMVAEQNPHTKLGTLIQSIEIEPDRKQIVELFLEWDRNVQMGAEFAIPLCYYLEMFDRLPGEGSLIEAGALVHLAGSIYSKRVNCVHDRVQQLNISLTDAETEINNSKVENTVKKTGQKRRPENPAGPYEANMSSKPFKTIVDTRRNEDSTSNTDSRLQAIRTKQSIDNLRNNVIHPDVWKYSIIKSLGNDGELDSKRNYKLFTSHIEHRYNSLRPDISFKMYYKMKDYVDEQCKGSRCEEWWPALSDDYIKLYVGVENQMLFGAGRSVGGLPRRSGSTNSNVSDSHNVTLNSIDDDVEMKTVVDMDETRLAEPEKSIDRSELQEPNLTTLAAPENEAMMIEDDNQASESYLESTVAREPANENHAAENQLISSNGMEDLSKIQISLPNMEGGISFADLGAKEQSMLSPTVVATKMFANVAEKKDIVVNVDESIKTIYNIVEPRTENSPTVETEWINIIPDPFYPTLSFNIFQIPPKHFKKVKTFKLGNEYALLKRERLAKRRSDAQRTQATIRSSEATAVRATSPDDEPEFYGFDEDEVLRELQQLKMCTEPLPTVIEEVVKDGLVQEAASAKPNRLNDSGVQILESIIIKPASNVSQNPLEDSGIGLDSTADSSGIEKYTDETSHESLGKIKSAIKRPRKSIETTIANPAREKDDDEETASESDMSEEETSMMRRVQEWHEYLAPILEQAEERHNYNVYDLGTEILEILERLGPGCRANLEQIMTEKDKSLISRYFLSTLLLVNQGNLSIKVFNKRPDRPSEWCDISIRVVSQKRHLSDFEDIPRPLRPVVCKRRITELKEICDAEDDTSNVQLVKKVPFTTPADDQDSGISMSDACSSGHLI